MVSLLNIYDYLTKVGKGIDMISLFMNYLSVSNYARGNRIKIGWLK